MDIIVIGKSGGSQALRVVFIHHALAHLGVEEIDAGVGDKPAQGAPHQQALIP